MTTAPTPIYFTVTGDWTGFSSGASVNGDVLFTPVFTQGQIATMGAFETGLSGLGVVPSPVKARIVNGVLYADAVFGINVTTSNPPVQLMANSGLNLTTDMYYEVTFLNITVAGVPSGIAPFSFVAPTSPTTLDLLSVTPAADPASPTGYSRGPQGYSFAGITPAGDGTHVQGLVDSATGPVPIGPEFAVSLAYNSTVTHGSVASTPRPPVTVAVIWIGSVLPTNAIDGDVWLDTSGSAPTITTTILDSLNVGATFSQTLLATGTDPISWSATGLPSWATLSSAGDLYGTPDSATSYSIAVTATNAYGSNTVTYSGTVGTAIGPTINTTLSDFGTVTAGVPFSLTLSASGSAPFTWSVSSGALPHGLTLSTVSGVTTISGIPDTVSSGVSFTLQCLNSVNSTTRSFTVPVVGVPPTITSTSINTLWRGFSTSQTLLANGTPPITWALKSGSGPVPHGMSLSSGGVLSGTPDTVTSYTFTAEASNGYTPVADETYTSVPVLESTPSITSTTLGTVMVGISFTKTISLSAGGGPSGITWTISSGSLPAGLNITSSTSTSVTISGVPTTPVSSWSYSFRLQADNGGSSSPTGYLDFSGTVSQPPVAQTPGSGVAGNVTASNTQSISVTANSGDTIIVGVGTTNNTAVSSVTYSGGGTVSSALATVDNGGSAGFGILNGYKITGVTGSGTLTVTMAASCAFSIAASAYSNVTTITVTSGSSTAETSASATATNVTGGYVVGILGASQAYSTFTSGTSRALGTYAVIGDSNGSGSQTITAGHTFAGDTHIALVLSPT